MVYINPKLEIKHTLKEKLSHGIVKQVEKEKTKMRKKMET